MYIYIYYISQAQKLGYGIDEMFHAWLLEMTGQDDDGCAGVSARLYCACTKVYPTLRGKQMIMMSLDDVTVITLM